MNSFSIIKILSTFLILSLLLISCATQNFPTNQRFYDEALNAYNNKKYKQAFALFESLAKTGDSDAQYNLWVMYTNAQGVKRDFYSGFAWLYLACEYGKESYVKERDKTLEKLNNKQHKQAMEAANQLLKVYGKQAQENQLKDALFPIPMFETGPTPVYPDTARQQKTSGYVILDLTVMPDGTTTDVRVIKSSDNQFEAASIQAAKNCKYQPAYKNGKPTKTQHIQSVTLFKFIDALNSEPRIVTKIDTLNGQQNIENLDLSYLLIPEATPLVLGQPNYPKKAAEWGVSGKVVLIFTIDALGKPNDIKVVNSCSSKPDNTINYNPFSHLSARSDQKFGSPYNPKPIPPAKAFTKAFEKESIRAIKKWRFAPAIINGKVSKTSSLTYTMLFILKN